ncbi:hypothetical protein LguiA_032207 [Lonicera macranthoides]
MEVKRKRQGVQLEGAQMKGEVHFAVKNVMQKEQVKGEQKVNTVIDDLLKGDNMSVQNGKNDELFFL